MPDRHIKKHVRYKEAVEKLANKFERAREVLSGAEWVLARSPEEGIYISSIDVFRALLICPDPMPNVHIYYAFDDRQIRLLTVTPL